MYKALASCLLIAGCASALDRGIDASRRGDNQTALVTFMQCANEGNSACMHNVGWMYENGRIRDPKPRDKAIDWYTLAARHGQPQSRVALARMGATVPGADLVRQKTAAEIQAEIDAAAALGEGLGNLLGAGIVRKK